MSDFDTELGRRFADLRATDEKDAPEFGAMLARAERSAATARHRAPRWLTIGVIAAAAACAVLAFLAVQRSRTNARVAEVWWSPDTLIDVTRFVSPTDGLLRSARHTLETRALFGSVLDGVAMPIQTTPFKGD
jgi:hypothetical protein